MRLKKILSALLCVLLLCTFITPVSLAVDSPTIEQFFEAAEDLPGEDEITEMSEDDFRSFYTKTYTPLFEMFVALADAGVFDELDEESDDFATFIAVMEKMDLIYERNEELEEGGDEPDPSEMQWEWQTQFYDFYDETSGLAYKIKDNNTVMVAPYYERGQNGYGNTSYRYAYTGAKTIPAQVTYNSTQYTVVGIDDIAFKDTKVTSVTMPDDSDDFTTIGMRAFLNCSITSITIPASVTEIGNGEWDGESFAGSSLQSVTFAEDSQLETISRSTFARCSSLSTLSVPDSVTYIGPGAFANCTSLSSVTVPANAEIEPNTFSSYYNSEANDNEGNVFFADGSQYQIQDGVLYNEDTLMNVLEVQEEVVIPEGIKYIGDSAFKVSPAGTKDDTLKSVTLPATLEKIGESAFEGNSGLTEIVIPEGVTEIGDRAFTGCSSVTTITIPSTVTTIGNSAFAGITADTTESSVAGFELPATSDVTVGGTLSLSLTNAPDGVTIAWSTSDSSIATVENGTITGVKEGSTTITATAKVGDTVLKTATCTVTVKPAAIPVTKITLSEASLSLREGKTATLTATVEPENATDKTITWTSSDESVAKVDANGVVTAVSKGTATIKATIGTVSDECTVTVTKKSSGGGGGSSTPSYSVSAPSKVENGTVKVSPTKAEKGDTVTITVTPDKGYEVDEVVVTDKNGKEISVKDKGNGKYTFTMPASKVDIEVSFAEIDTTCDGGKDCPSYHFDDVNVNDWYHEAVDYMVERGLMNGTSATTFEPNTTTTRAMLVSVLYRLENTPVVVGAANFNDVPAGQYYTDAVAWANANGIVTGYGNGNFGPNDTLTREQMAAIIYRYAAYKGYDVSARANLSGYTDAAQISGYAADAMAWINAEEIISGTSATTLSPAGNATRCQFAVILMRFCENVAK